jgi:hypothetical protein
MHTGLISAHEEERLFRKLFEYYTKLYPKAKFTRIERKLTPRQIGQIYYTYPGEEAQVTFIEKSEEIADALPLGYSTPIIILNAGNKMFLLDGHRRVRVAWLKKKGWDALLIYTDKKGIEFGIERMVEGKVADLWK